jgi:hypothetical protein
MHANAVRMRKKVEERAKSSRKSTIIAGKPVVPGCLRSGQQVESVLKH